VLDHTERLGAGRTGSRTFVDTTLFARRDAGDPAAREQLVERSLPLARHLARRYEHAGESIEDLEQVASLGLVKAVDRFQPSQGNAFSSFAVPTIVGELKRHLRDRTWVVRPPRGLQELSVRVRQASGQLTDELDRAPTVSELAAALQTGEEQILEALAVRDGRGALSLQAVPGGDDNQQPLQDTLASHEDGFALAELRALLDGLMATLSERARDALWMRFEHDLTQAQIAQQLGITQMQAFRLIRQSLKALREIADRELLTVSTACA
jgi:RNA polymerase sigma-B factor